MKTYKLTMNGLNVYCVVVSSILILFGCGQPKDYHIVDTEQSSRWPKMDTSVAHGPGQFDSSLRVAIQEYAQIYGSIDTIKVNGKRRFLIEGDLLLSDSGLMDHFTTLERPESFLEPERQYITVRSHRGNVLLLTNPERVLYAIEKKSFQKNEKIYNRVKLSLQAAADKWNSICGVKFEHRSEWDERLEAGGHPEELFFIVRYTDSTGDFVASSFFPHYKNRQDRELLVSKHYESSKYDSVGVFRHELGHAMGFLHEHLRAGVAAKCPDESSARHFNVGDYDPKSVMHYYCKTIGFGTYELSITPIDSAGAIHFYPK